MEVGREAYFTRESLLKGRTSTIDLLVLISSDLLLFILNLWFFFTKLNEGINRTELSPLGRVPCFHLDWMQPTFLGLFCNFSPWKIIFCHFMAKNHNPSWFSPFFTIFFAKKISGNVHLNETKLNNPKSEAKWGSFAHLQPLGCHLT